MLKRNTDLKYFFGPLIVAFTLCELTSFIEERFAGPSVIIGGNWLFGPLNHSLVVEVSLTIILALIFFVVETVKKRNEMIVWGILIGAAIANVFERFYFGYVRDYWFWWHNKTNLSDYLIIISLIYLLTGLMMINRRSA